jgi:glycosyltransferase involved in cell wall biosynthesis
VRPVDVSVVVCAHDEGRWNEIRAAIDSVERQSVPAYEVVLVVDHNDRLLERIRRELNVRAVPNTGVRGLGGARNSGLEATSGTVVAYLDDDAVASPDWIAQLSREYEDPTVAGVGGGAEPRWEAERPEWFPAEFDWVVGCSYLGMPEEPKRVRNLFGCNMSYRRELLEQLGGFRLGYGCDETELCIRLGQQWPDRQLVYVPSAKVSHHVPVSRTRFRRFLERCFFEGGSKAVVTRLVGAADGLASEVAYTREVLPRGIRRGVTDFMQRRDSSGLARAGAILAGLASTTAGYLWGLVTFERAAARRGFGD